MTWKNYLKVTVEMGLENYKAINSQFKAQVSKLIL